MFSLLSVSPGGKNSSEAPAGLCGVLRGQRLATDRSHHLRGHRKRYLNTVAPRVFYVQTEKMIGLYSRLETVVQCYGNPT